MALGRSKREGRYVVENVPVVVSGKGPLQQALNRGEEQGMTLHSVVYSDKHGWLLVVWERPQEHA